MLVKPTKDQRREYEMPASLTNLAREAVILGNRSIYL